MSGDARKGESVEVFRCRSCFHKPKPGCAMCGYWGKVNVTATECLDCGFVSNVPALIAAHDFGHTEDT